MPEKTTAGERRVLAGAASGELVDLSDLSDKQRVVSADLIRRLCVGPKTADVDPRGIRIKGARIVEPLDLSFCTVPHPLRFEATTFDAIPDLSWANLPALWIEDSSFPGLQAPGIRVDDLRLGSSEVSGEVQLLNARIGGELHCSGATLTNEGGIALFADAAEIDGRVFLRYGFSATGEVRLLGARIGGQLDCSGATLTNEGGPALNADGARINGDVFLREGFSANGELRLSGARIGGQVDCPGATLTNKGGAALTADLAEINEGMYLREGFSATGELRLPGAKIGGPLDFSGATFTNEGGVAVFADGAEINGRVFLCEGFSATGEVRLLGARIGGQLDCSGATLSNEGGVALFADGVEINADVFLRDGFSSNGELRLPGARIGGQVDGQGATLTNEGGAALNADLAEINDDVFLRDGFSATGALRLLNAKIGGQLNCSGATLTNEDDVALAADGAEINGDLFLRDGFGATGAVRLLGARIGGQVDCSGATLTNEGGALFADDAEIDESVYLRDGFSTFGEVRFLNAKIGGHLDCSGATLVNTDGIALAARDATISSALIFRNVRVTGGVDLFRASATTLDDDLGQADHPLGSWRGVQPLVLDSFAYARFSHEAKWDSKLRRRWLEQTCGLQQEHSSGFQHGAWQQLIEVYRAQGRDDEATRAAIAMHNDRVARADLPWYRAWGRRVLGWLVGHGYRPWLAGIWATAIVAAFALVVWHWSGMFLPEQQGVTGSPQPIAYAADAFLPIIDLGQADSWLPTAWLRWVEWSVILLGWSLSTIFVAGFSRIVRSE
ncbi:MAG TPA: hypothetical protein VGQ68_06400 [Gaiellaceae bacterium]|jgi:hypothetical protein|nr:hypothetical protein [Gaiellaceae bacterium]